MSKMHHVNSFIAQALARYANFYHTIRLFEATGKLAREEKTKSRLTDKNRIKRLTDYP
jgi:hypothetical protein